jgi:adenosylmethionine-8-amino-7-oxononanoate aminotransferase
VFTRVAMAESVIITVCPPLVADTAEFDELAAALQAVLKPVADDWAAL